MTTTWLILQPVSILQLVLTEEYSWAWKGKEEVYQQLGYVESDKTKSKQNER